jgi:rhodanese-related sulfurtransferase
MKTRSLFFMLFIAAAMVFTGCKDEQIATPKFDILSDYLVANDLDLPTIMSYNDGGTAIKFVAFPAAEADVPAFIAKYHIIDIRSTADFALGHISGAVNKPADANGSYASVLTEAANAGTKPILMVCYSGQTACYVTALLRLYGYPKTQALKWGMSGWNSQFDKWTSKIGNIAQNNANWTAAAAPANVASVAPVINAIAEEGQALLKERVETVIAAGFKTVSGSDVLTTPSNYQINNYFGATDYTAFGHVTGAFRINPLTVTGEEIMYLDPSKKIATYCYTGQTSAIITAYLRVIGYDAYSILWGMNGLYNSSTGWDTAENLPNKWTASKPKAYAVVTK